MNFKKTALEKIGKNMFKNTDKLRVDNTEIVELSFYDILYNINKLFFTTKAKKIRKVKFIPKSKENEITDSLTLGEMLYLYSKPNSKVKSLFVNGESMERILFLIGRHYPVLLSNLMWGKLKDDNLRCFERQCLAGNNTFLNVMLDVANIYDFVKGCEFRSRFYSDKEIDNLRLASCIFDNYQFSYNTGLYTFVYKKGDDDVEWSKGAGFRKRKKYSYYPDISEYVTNLTVKIIDNISQEACYFDDLYLYGLRSFVGFPTSIKNMNELNSTYLLKKSNKITTYGKHKISEEFYNTKFLHACSKPKTELSEGFEFSKIKLIVDALKNIEVGYDYVSIKYNNKKEVIKL